MYFKKKYHVNITNPLPFEDITHIKSRTTHFEKVVTLPHKPPNLQIFKTMDFY
jgi:hypothetical protein